MKTLYRRLNHLTYMLENIPDKELLIELVKALSNDEAKSNFDFICSMWDIPKYD